MTHQVHDVRQDLAEKKARVACAEGPGRLHVLHVAHLQCLAPDEAAQAHPGGDPKGDAELPEPPLHDGEHGDEEEYAGDGRKDLVDVLDQVIDPAPVVAGEKAEDDGKEGRYEEGHDADDEGGAHPFQGIVKDILAEDVRAEKMEAFQGEFLAVELRCPHHGRRVGEFHRLLGDYVEGRPAEVQAPRVPVGHGHHIEEGDEGEEAYDDEAGNGEPVLLYSLRRYLEVRFCHAFVLTPE